MSWNHNAEANHLTLATTTTPTTATTKTSSNNNNNTYKSNNNNNNKINNNDNNCKTKFNLIKIQFSFRANDKIIRAATNFIIKNNTNNIFNYNNKINWLKPALEDTKATADADADTDTKVMFIVSKSFNLIFNNLINVLFLFCWFMIMFNVYL